MNKPSDVDHTMKLLGFNAWKCKIDREQELQKIQGDKTISDDEDSKDGSNVDDDVENASLSSEDPDDDSIDEVAENLEETMLESDDNHSQKSDDIPAQNDESQQLPSDIDTSSASEIDSSDLSDATSDEEIDSSFELDDNDGDGDEFELKDNDGNIIFSSGKDGLMSSARWFSRLMMAASVFSQRTLIRKFAKLHPECDLIQKVVSIIKQESFRKKCKAFTKFSVLHLNYSAFNHHFSY